MKNINVGSGSSENYANISLKKAPKQNNFGTLFYLNEAIHLVQNNAVNDYTVSQSKFNDMPQLNLTFTPELKKEFQLIREAITQYMPELKMKPLDGDRLYIKLGKDCGQIPNNCNLRYRIRVYAVFQQVSGAAYLQYDVVEHVAEKISLLSPPTINYVPNSINWNAPF